MKLLISFMMFISWRGHAASPHPVLVSYDFRFEEARMVREIIHQKTGLPLSLISIESSQLPCEERSDLLLWHLCVNNYGQLHEVTVDLNFIRKGIKIFKTEEQK